MSDFLLEISENPFAKKLATRLGVPVPPLLRRSSNPWMEKPLEGLSILVGGKGQLGATLATTLAEVGGEVIVDGGAEVEAPFKALDAQLSKPVVSSSTLGDSTRLNALLFDASGVRSVDDLAAMHEFFSARIRSLSKNGRILILGRTVEEQKEPEAAATTHALEGFVRSLAKEVGRKGATANLIHVAARSRTEARSRALMRFLLSEHSAYITGQIFSLNSAVSGPESPLFVKPLEDKVAMVTGAARGIGAATARALAREGARVVCLDRPADAGKLEEVAREIGGTAFAQDVSEEDAPQKIVAFLKEKFGGLDVVVHNAGVTRDKTLAKMTSEQWKQVMDVNLKAVVRITEALLKDGLRRNGRIICLSSIAGIAGNFGQTNYAASKSAIIGLVQNLAPRLTTRGITANAIAPGFIETRMTAAIPFATREVARRLSNLSQGGLPEDVANAITFLASPGACGVTGSVIRVCGGNMVGA